MKTSNLLSLVRISGLIFLISLAFAFSISVQREIAHGGLLTVADAATKQERFMSQRLTAAQRRLIESDVKALASDLNGTWELAERTVNNAATKNQVIRLETKGTMVFNLKSSGMKASGDLLIMEEGLGNLAASPDVATGEAFSIGSYNNVEFQGNLESGVASASHVSQQNSVVISEKLSGEILGSYGAFRTLTKYSDSPDQLPKYRRVSAAGAANGSTFTSKGRVVVPNGNVDKSAAGGDTDKWDVEEVTNDSMILSIPDRGIRDVWKKTSKSVQIEGQPLARYWQTLKRSGRLLKPTYKARAQ